MQEYHIVERFSIFDLERETKFLISLGWLPIGGVSVSASHKLDYGSMKFDGMSYAQAMKRTKLSLLTAKAKKWIIKRKRKH